MIGAWVPMTEVSLPVHAGGHFWFRPADNPQARAGNMQFSPF